MRLSNYKLFSFWTLVLCLYSILPSFGQGQTQSISTTLTPGSGTNGPEVRVTLTYKFINVFGEVVIPMSASTHAISDAYWHKGKRYTSAEIGQEVFSKMRFFCPDITADIFKGSARVSSFSKNCVIEGMGSALGESYNPGWKTADIGGESALSQYSLRNLRVQNKNMADNWYAFESAINKYEQDKTEKANLDKYNQLIARADQAFQQQQWEQASELYKEAQPLNRSSNYPREQLSKIADQQKASERAAQFQAKVEAGNAALAQNDHVAARQHYQEATRLSDSPKEAQDGLKRVEEAEKSQKTEQSTTEASAKKAEGTEGKEEAAEKTEDRATGSGESSTTSQREDPQIAAQKAEAERRRQEFERQQRVKEYQTRMDQERSENMAVAAGAGASMLLMHYYVAERIFSDVGVYHPENTFYANALKLRGQLGYQISSAPIFKNVSQEEYDGNTYNYVTSTQNYQTGTLDFVAQGELWPVYGDKFGLGLNAGGYAGHGFLFQNFSWGYNYGLRTFVGSNTLQLQLDYQGGLRNFSYFNWIEPTQFADGKSRFNFIRYGIGPRFVWEKDQRKNAHSLSIQAIFENPDFRQLAQSNNPIIWRWFSGIRAEFDMLHGVNGFMELIPSYQRSGTVEYAFDEDATFGDLYFRIGVVRNFDLFGGSAYDLTYDQAKKALSATNRTTLLLPSVGFTWFEADSNGSAFNHFIKPVVNILGVEKEWDLLPWMSIGSGVSAAALQGAEYKLKGIGNIRYRYQEFGLDIPLHARIYTKQGIISNSWLLAGIKAYVPLYRQWQERQLPDGIGFNDRPLTTAQFSAYRLSNVLGAGIDFPTGDAKLLRIGLVYERTRSVIESTLLPYHLQGLQFMIGLIY